MLPEDAFVGRAVDGDVAGAHDAVEDLDVVPPLLVPDVLVLEVGGADHAVAIERLEGGGFRQQPPELLRQEHGRAFLGTRVVKGVVAIAGAGADAHVHGVELLRVEAQRHAHRENGATRVAADQRVLHGR